MKKNIEDYPECIDIKNNFKNSELGEKYLKDIERIPIQEFKLGLSTSLEPQEYQKSSLFNGIVDYICVKSGILYVLDWKSGRYKEERYMDYSQLLFYAIYFFQKYKPQKIMISYVYIEHNLENSIELDIEYLDNYKRELLTNIKNIESDLVFAEKKSKLCNWCGFKELCFPEL
jgi:CRISPR/Cas system-associated exonuclease Cas4 (RecB family)